MKEELEKQVGLPENAFRPLKPGEKYEPLMSPDKEYPEVNFRSVSWGIIMAIIFSAAAAFLGLKVGQVFEAAIPIAIIAVGVSSATKRKGALGENVIIQSIGACSGVIVAGAIFTLPALYILQEKYPEMTVNFMQMFISSLLGGVLGILFLIPFRKYFVKEKHGEYPFPEATASTQVLVSGEKGGDQAKPLLLAGLVGGLYDFIVGTLGWWNENFTSRVCGWGEALADKFKLVFKINTGAAVLGLGYIVGLKYAAIICAGSIAVWLIIVPGLSLIWGDQVLNAWNPDITLAVKDMTPEQIFSEYAKSIGIGGIAMAGIIGIVRSWDIIKSAVSLAGKEMGGKKVTETTERTQKDLSMKFIAFGSIFTLLLIFSMGLGLGLQEDFFAQLASLGLHSFLFCLLPTAGSALVVYAGTLSLTQHVDPALKGHAGASGTRKRKTTLDPMMFYAIGVLVLGVGCGVTPGLSTVLCIGTFHSILWLNYRLFAILATVDSLRDCVVTKRTSKGNPSTLDSARSPAQAEPAANYVIEFFNEDVRLLVEAFPNGIRARTFALFLRMEIMGSHLPNELTKAMGDGLFELRARAKEGIGRTFYDSRRIRRIWTIRRHYIWSAVPASAAI